MKRFISSAVVLCLAFAVFGCSAPKTKTADKDKPKSETLAVDENLLTVDVTLPASYFEDSSEEEVRSGAKENGFKNVVFNEDGSVTYTMTKKQHRELLKEYKESVDKAIDDMINGKEPVESFQEVSYNKNMSEFNVKVDRDKYSVFDSMSALVFYFSGMYYQALSGVDAADNKVIVNFVDAKTGEVIESGDSSKMGESEN